MHALYIVTKVVNFLFFTSRHIHLKMTRPYEYNTFSGNMYHVQLVKNLVPLPCSFTDIKL